MPWFKRRAKPTPAPTPTPARKSPPVRPAPKPSVTVEGFAQQLVDEFPNGIRANELWDRCDAVGLDMVDVDRAMDDIRYRIIPTVVEVTAGTMRVHDLTGLDSVRMRVKGSVYWVSHEERAQFGGLRYLLVREPTNEHDANAVAVYGGGRKVGHVAASRAASMSPLLEALGFDAYEVSGTAVAPGSPSLWVDLPKTPALRAHVSRFVSERDG